MARKLLDTSVLIRYWSKCRPEALQRVTVQDASNSGKSLTRLVNTDAIVTPVYLEFVAGVMSAHELKLARAYLEQFRVIDGGIISRDDWTEARRIAERVPTKPVRRQLVDCLVRALANRLRYDVVAFDRRFPS